MHAKKTRDRKKQFLDISEKIITEMEAEAESLRKYLLSINAITEDDIIESHERTERSKQKIANLMVSHSLWHCNACIDTSIYAW